MILNIKVTLEINDKVKIKGDVFKIKESHETKEWKEKHRGWLEKIKTLGTGSTSSSVIYTQWWRYVIKKCQTAQVQRHISKGWSVGVYSEHCDGFNHADYRKKKSASWLFNYITGDKKIGDSPLFIYY